MSDDLLKRLRSTVTEQDTEGEKYELPYNPDGQQAADRIEELKAKLRASAMQELSALGQAQDAHQARLEAEAKLAKAVGALREAIRLADQPHYGDRGDALDHCFDAIDVLRTTLAELTGGKDG